MHPLTHNFVFRKIFSLKERRETALYCISTRGVEILYKMLEVLNLWTLEMSNKVHEILSFVGDTSKYKYTRGDAISRACVQTYSGVELQTLKILCTIAIQLNVIFNCILCLKFDCINVYLVIL